jgi:hypothetical protein
MPKSFFGGAVVDGINVASRTQMPGLSARGMQ